MRKTNNQELEIRLREVEYELSHVQQENHKKESEFNFRIIELEALSIDTSRSSKIMGHDDFEEKLKFFEDQV